MAGEAIIKSYDKYVLVSLSDDALSAQEIKSTMSKSIEEAAKGSLNILVHRDMPAKQRASITDFYFLAEYIAKSSFKKKLALVYPKETQLDKIDFFETASKNRGVNIALFSTMEEALSWIEVKD